MSRVDVRGPADASVGGLERILAASALKVLIVSGIWPPDIGGPATHAPEVAEALVARRNAVEVVTTASTAPPPGPAPVRFVSRRLPPGPRHAAVVELIARRARHADVVYAASMVGRSALA